MSVVIETTVGDITVDLFLEERPLACLNFIKLCKLKYYNFNLFHTIEQDFIAQTGDPTGVGNGGSSIWGVIEGPRKRFFEAESVPKILHTSVGLLSLVSPTKNLVGSQFFFTLGADLTSLDGQHCVIGEVVDGHETLRCLNEAIVDEKNRPYKDIRITHTVILEDPFPDMRGFRAPSRSPSPTAERLQNGRIAADEDIDDTEGKSMEEIQEMLAEREAKARATILEIVGDLPDAEAAPPENVLFICKLNPVTTEDDLEIIFSRFGKVVSCEVIRDKKTGDSLQYAFVEFDNEKACEAAYFKMNNVLIDDRRIHVDFSQSVARVKWRGKGRGVTGEQGRLDFRNLRENDGNTQPQRSAEDRLKARKQRHRERDEAERHRSPTRRENNNSRMSRYRNSREKSREYRRQESPNRQNRGRRESPEKRRRFDEREISNRRRYEEILPSAQRKRREESPKRMRREDSADNAYSRRREVTLDRREENANSSYKRRRQETPDRREKLEISYSSKDTQRRRPEESANGSYRRQRKSPERRQKPDTSNRREERPQARETPDKRRSEERSIKRREHQEYDRDRHEKRHEGNNERQKHCVESTQNSHEVEKSRKGDDRRSCIKKEKNGQKSISKKKKDASTSKSSSSYTEDSESDSTPSSSSSSSSSDEIRKRSKKSKNKKHSKKTIKKKRSNKHKK